MVALVDDTIKRIAVSGTLTKLNPVAAHFQREVKIQLTFINLRWLCTYTTLLEIIQDTMFSVAVPWVYVRGSREPRY